MSTDRDTTRIVRSWLEEGVTALPDRVLDTVLDQVPATPQRRSWWPARRSRQMTRFFIAASAAAAVLVVAIVAFNLLPRGNFGGQPSAAPTSASSPTLAPSPTGLLMLPSGPLAAGTYTAHPFASPNAALEVTLTVPSGWHGFPPNAVFPEAGTEPPGGAAVAFLLPTELYVDPCEGNTSGSPVISAGETVDDLVRVLEEGQFSYDVGPATDVTLGGFSGKRIDLVVPSDLDFTACDSGQYWIWEPGPNAQGPGNRWNLWILDVDGTRVVILGHDFPTTALAVRDQLQAIVASVRLEP